MLVRPPEICFIDDKTGKSVGNNSHISRRPIAAFGNSDGVRRLMLRVHHDDAKPEFEYGAKSHIGTFSDSLMAGANQNGWIVISMKDDWNRIFPFDQSAN